MVSSTAVFTDRAAMAGRPGRAGPPSDERLNLRSSIPFFAVHFVPFLAVFTGVPLKVVVLAFVTFAVRMFFITGGYHRYFSHRSYRLGRFRSS